MVLSRFAALVAIAACVLACKTAKPDSTGSSAESRPQAPQTAASSARPPGKREDAAAAAAKRAKRLAPTKVGSKANASNTGPSNRGALRPWPYGSTYLDTPGAVYENFALNGCIEIDADNITLRNFVINCDGGYGIRQYNGHEGTIIEDGEITGRLQSAGIYGLGFTARRIYIHDGEGDAIKTDSMSPGLTIVEDSFVECMGVGVPDPHTDAVQIEVVPTHPGMIFRRNHFYLPTPNSNPKCPTAAGGSGIFTVTDGVANVDVYDNWLNGGTFTVDVEAASLDVHDNLFGHDNQYGVKRGNFGGTWTNNRWEDTLKVIP